MNLFHRQVKLWRERFGMRNVFFAPLSKRENHHLLYILLESSRIPSTDDSKKSDRIWRRRKRVLSG